MRTVRERFIARVASKRPRSGVYPRMSMQVAAVLETFSTDITDKRTPIRMDPRMLHQISVGVKAFLSCLTLERFFAAMSARVIIELRVRHELFPTHMANKHLDPDVDLLVFADCAQLEESLVTHRTSVMPFTCVCPAMCCQI